MKNSILEKARWLREVALATSKNNGARVAREWLKYAAMFVMLLTLGSGNAWAETHTLGWGSATGSQGTYTNFTATSGTVTGIVSFTTAKNKSSNNPAYNSDNSDLRLYYHSGGDGGSITLTPASGVTITGFTITTSTSPTTKYKVDNGGLTQITLSQNTGSVSGLSVGSSSSITIQNCNTSNTQLRIKTIAITYTAGGTSHTLSSAVSPAASGSVELSATSVAEGSTATATATPAAHYVFDHWSISGTGSTLSSTTTNPTTVTMGTADATVTATFVAAPKASITLSEAGATTTDATTYYVGDSYILPSTTEASCGTKVLVGWSTVTVSETDIKPASNFYEKGETVTLEASQTFYAVFANASGGGGGAPTAYTAGDEGTYVLAIYVSDTWYALPANPTVSSGKIRGVEITVSNTGGVDYVTSTNASGYKWTIANATNGQTISDGSKYIYHSNGGTSGTNLTYGNGTTYTWTIESEQKGLTFKGTNGTTVGSRGLLASGTTFGGYSLSNEDASGYYRIHVVPIGGGTTYSAYSTSCQACVAPTSVTITGTNKYLGGQTISLTAAPDGGTGTPSYQWQKKISGVWTNLENGNGISGATDAILQISSCTHANSGGYRCIVSTGDGCETKSHADDTNGYGVHVYSIHGKYTSDANYADAEIIWTSETTGTATIHLNAKKTYLFKVWSNNGYYYGHGAKANEDFMFQPTTWDCGTDNREMRLFTTVEGDYTFTVNIEHGLDGSPYVNLQVGYPSMTHPNTGYVYVQKFSWTPRLHYWYNDANKLTEWNDDPSLASDQYVNICGTDYWCVPVIDYYCNFIAADHNGQTTGDRHTNSPHPGQRLYNDGSWKWGEFSTYTITYAGGDGSTGGPMESHTGLCPGSSQQLTVNAFSKSGYNFSGWTANVDVKIGGSTVPAGTLITGTPIIENVQSNITLTAQWAANTYTITYNGVKTGAENTNPTSYTVEDLPINLVAATHDQWRFDGWTDDNAGDADITTIPAGTTGNQSFTAHWTQRYAVTWYEESTPTVTYFDPGATLTFPSPDPSAPASCSEKKFVGWMVGTIEGETDDKPTFITAGEVNADAAYHAVWANSAGSAIAAVEDNTFTQSEVSNATYCGISNGLQSVGKYVQKQSIWNASQMTGVHVKIKVYHVSNNRADVLRISLINSSGEEVVGTDLTTSKLGNSSLSAGYSSNVTLTPTTAVTGYKVSLKTKNSSGTSVGKVTREVVPAYSKYSTSCCDNNVAAPSVMATATRNSITLSWANVTGATGYKVTINGGTHDVTTAACTFTASGLNSGTDYAWTVIATYNPANYCGAIPTKNTTTTLSVYGVTYNKNTTIGSGTVTMSPMPSDASTYVVGENVTAAAKPATCTNSGYTFNGWNTEPDGTGTHVDAEGTIAMVEGGLTLYAEWVAKRAYYVDRMHGQGDQTIEIGGKTYHCYYGDGYHITPSPSDQKSGDACQAPHYRFVRWLTIGHINADGTQKDTGGAVSGGVQRGTVTDGETYYAIWEEEIE